MSGWIKIHNKILEWEWFSDPNVFRMWVYLLLVANYKETEWRGIKIGRGQLIVSVKTLSEKLGISVRSVRTCLEKLKTTNNLTIKTTNKYSIVTISKYDDYQIFENKNDKQNDKQIVTKTTTDIEYKNTEYTEIERKENKKEKKAYADFVTMAEVEYEKLVLKYGKDATDWMIEKLSTYKGAKGVKYKSDYLAILNWVVDKLKREYKPQKQAGFVP